MQEKINKKNNVDKDFQNLCFANYFMKFKSCYMIMFDMLFLSIDHRETSRDAPCLRRKWSVYLHFEKKSPNLYAKKFDGL